MNVDVAGTVDGGAHNDTLSVAGHGTPQTISLNNDSATALNGGGSGGFASIESFIGDNATGMFVGPDVPNTWSVSSENDGTVAGVSFTDMANLTGGAGTDAVTIGPSGTLTGAQRWGWGQRSDTNGRREQLDCRWREPWYP